MDQNQQERKEFLEQELQRTKERIGILDDIDEKLHKMKKIAEYAKEHELSEAEAERLNEEITALQQECAHLKKFLDSTVH